jgi:hypothetical protein
MSCLAYVEIELMQLQESSIELYGCVQRAVITYVGLTIFLGV